MGTPRYLLRFDDLCPTMNWPIWESVEAILLEEGVKPILAVIPDNQDEKCRVSPPVDDFWQRVRTWRNYGWTIALHGYQHTYLTPNGGILRIAPRSEFAGVLASEQERRLRAAIAIFQREGLDATVWVAPSHSFDSTTLALLKKCGVTTISDGFARYPFLSGDGLFWVPMQLWQFHPAPAGVWTVCNHINNWSADDARQFCANVKQYRHAISSLDDIAVEFAAHRRGGSDVLAGWGLRGLMRLKRAYVSLKPALDRLHLS